MIFHGGYRQVPAWWTRQDHSLQPFKGGKSSGTSIAALKVVLGICSLCEMGGFHAANATYQKIQNITGLSRPMISKGIKFLEDMRIIEVNRRGYISEYKFLSSEQDKGFFKVPCSKMYSNLQEIPNRGEAALAALKIYIYLLSRRSKGKSIVGVTYDSIRKGTGIAQRRVRLGIDVLINHGFVHVMTDEEHSAFSGYPCCNQYKILGELGKW